MDKDTYIYIYICNQRVNKGVIIRQVLPRQGSLFAQVSPEGVEGVAFTLWVRRVQGFRQFKAWVMHFERFRVGGF